MTTIRIGRNDPCWCGSGIKYKNCHLRRAEQPEVGIQESLEQARAALSFKNCLHPTSAECSGTIVRAHSVQRNGGLSKITTDGRVYSFFGNNIMDIEKHKGLLAPKLDGVGNASTFTGLCSFHDNAVFSPIEKNPFVATQEHTFLLGYRFFCKELFTKKAVAAMIPHMRNLDRGRPIEHQYALHEFLSAFEPGREQGLKDTEEIKRRYDQALLATDFSEVRYYVLRLNETPELMCSSGHFPGFDFDGARLQSLLDLARLPDHVTFSLIATDSGGAAVFSWLGSNPSSEQLVKSLHKKNDSDIVQALVRYCFEYFENVFFSPIWWDRLDPNVQTAIRERISLAANVLAERMPDCLQDDGISSVRWTVTSRETNLAL